MKIIFYGCVVWSVGLGAAHSQRIEEFKKDYKFCMKATRRASPEVQHKRHVDCKHLFLHNTWLDCLHNKGKHHDCLNEAHRHFNNLKK